MTTQPRHPRTCTATKRNGEPCTRWAIAGGTVCPAHGGSTAHVKAAAQRRLRTAQAQADAAAALAHSGVSAVDNPLEELGKLAAEVLALKDALAQRVNALNNLEAATPLGSVQLRAEVELYERALDRSGKFLDLLVKHDFEGKRLAISEAHAQLLAGVIHRALAAANLTPEQTQAARAAVASELRQLEPHTPEGACS